MHQPHDKHSELPAKNGDANPHVTAEQKATKDAQESNLQNVNTPADRPSQTNETPAHIAAQMHAPYPEKPAVQHQNEALTNDTPTGYAPHDPNLDLDAEQLKTIKPANKEAYAEVKQRVDEAHKQPATKK